MDRSKIDNKYKWKLEDLYKDIKEYEKDITLLNNLVEEFKTYKGKILENENTFLKVLELNEKIDMISNKLYVYVNMKLHEDTREGKYQELSGNLDILLSNISEMTSFFIPELLEHDYKEIKEYIDKFDKLKRFEFLLEVIFNDKEHILSKDIEELLSRENNIFSLSDNIFSNLNDADLTFKNIKDENGKEVELTKGNYYIYSISIKREVRKNAFYAL